MASDARGQGPPARFRPGRVTAVLLSALAAALVCHAGDPPPGKGAPKKGATHLDWVPPDAGLVVHVRVAELLASEPFKVLREAVPDLFGKLEGEAFKDLKVKDLEALTLAMASASGGLPFLPGMGGKGKDAIPLMVVTVARPAVLADLRRKTETNAQGHKYKGQTYYTDPNDPNDKTAVHFSGDRTVVIGPVALVRRGLEGKGKAPAGGAYAAALDKALSKHQLVVGLKLSGELGAEFAAQFKLGDRTLRRLLRPLAGMKELLFTADLARESRADLRLFFPDKKAAEQAVPGVQDLLVILRLGLAMGVLDPIEDAVEKATGDEERAKLRFQLLCLEEVEKALRLAKVERQGEAVRIALRLKLDFTALEAKAKAPAGKKQGEDKQGEDKQGEAKKRKASAENLKQFALAAHDFHDSYKWFPPPAICSKEGKPLLSWRVALLPYLEQNELYKQFKLDEPWDSAHNKKLLEKMPEVFATPGVETKKPHTTFYQALVGPGAAWELKPNPNAFLKADGFRIPSFTDGTSNTLLLVETGKAVPWTKPDDVRFDPKKKLPKLGGVFKGGFHVALADGSVRFVPATVSEDTLRAVITRNAGDIPGNDWD